MFTRISSVAVILALPLLAQQAKLDPRSTMHITMPEDAPLSVVSADWGESNVTPRGGAVLLDLHTSLVLKNASSRKVRAVTLLVKAQDVTPGGKGSVSVASLNVQPGQTFPVRIDLSLVRPAQTGSGALVEISLDGILFDDLTFYGPNQLNSRRSMTVWELEAVRDRQHFKEVLSTRGRDGLKSAMVDSLQRQANRTHLDARVTGSRASAVVPSSRHVQFAFVNAPNAPVEVADGSARVASNSAHSPRFLFLNKSGKAIDSLEMGWIVTDFEGKEYVAGAFPLEVGLAPFGKTTVVQPTAFRFAQSGGQPIEISSMKAYLSSVQFDDGRVWIPERSRSSPTPSPEEQRLAELFRRKGVDALIEELKKH